MTALSFQQNPDSADLFGWGYLSPYLYFSLWIGSIDKNVTDSNLKLVHADKRYMLYITLYMKATIFEAFKLDKKIKNTFYFIFPTKPAAITELVS